MSEVREAELAAHAAARAAGYGSTFLCWDVLFTQLVNPQIGLDLEGTLMQGKPCCHYRWYVKP